jgi:ribonuclease HI
MNAERIQYLLLTETYPEPGEQVGGQWRFVLQEVNGNNRLEVSDSEPGVCGERLQLLAVLRGLEAIDGGADVTLVTSSRYVAHGIRYGLEQWRESEWQWERFGEMTPISNLDLWRRVDHALKFHVVECRVWRLQAEETQVTLPVFEPKPEIFQPRRPRRRGWTAVAAKISQRMNHLVSRTAVAFNL